MSYINLRGKTIRLFPPHPQILSLAKMNFSGRREIFSVAPILYLVLTKHCCYSPMHTTMDFVHVCLTYLELEASDPIHLKFYFPSPSLCVYVCVCVWSHTQFPGMSRTKLCTLLQHFASGSWIFNCMQPANFLLTTTTRSITRPINPERFSNWCKVYLCHVSHIKPYVILSHICVELCRILPKISLFIAQ